jgi:hypothetical protein
VYNATSRIYVTLDPALTNTLGDRSSLETLLRRGIQSIGLRQRDLPLQVVYLMCLLGSKTSGYGTMDRQVLPQPEIIMLLYNHSELLLIRRSLVVVLEQVLLYPQGREVEGE